MARVSKCFKIKVSKLINDCKNQLLQGTCPIYVGCFADVIASPNRDLGGLGLTYVNNIGGGSIANCTTYCLSLGFFYAGVQVG
jgi:hypothetical protein